MKDLAVIFDLDGTLLDTLDDLADSVNATLAHFGYPQRSREEICAFVGNGAEKLIRLSVPENCQNVQDVFAYFQVYYRAHSQIKTAPYSGIIEEIHKIAKEYPIAIVSNKPDPAVKILCDGYFPGVYARGESAECRRKPEPDMVYAAMKALHAEKAIYVGDSEVDITTSQNAGVPCISVLWGFRDAEELLQCGAQYVCAETKELLPLIQKVEKENGK